MCQALAVSAVNAAISTVATGKHSRGYQLSSSAQPRTNSSGPNAMAALATADADSHSTIPSNCA